MIAELFVTRSLALNKEQLQELREAEEAGDGRADIAEVLRALVGLGAAVSGRAIRARPRRASPVRVNIESVPAIRRICANRPFAEIHRRDAALAPRPRRCRTVLGPTLRARDGAADRARQRARLAKLSEGSCDLNDVAGIIERIVAVSVLALTRREAERKTPARLVARDAR